MVAEKKIYVTEDGREFSTKAAAVKNENLTALCKEFDVINNNEVTEFVNKVAEHNMGCKVKPVIGTDWAKWTERERTMFIDVAKRVQKVNFQKSITVKMYWKSVWSREERIEAEFHSVFEPEDHSWEKLLEVLPEDVQTKYKDLSEYTAEGVKTVGVFNEEKSTEDTFWYKMDEVEMDIEEKMTQGIKLSDSDMMELVSGDAVYEEKDTDLNRWSQNVLTVVEISGQQYAINWQRGLTENQENSFYDQPVKCHLETREVVQTVTEVVLDKN